MRRAIPSVACTVVACPVALMVLACQVAAQVTVLPTAPPAAATAQMLAPSLSVAVTAGSTQTLASITDNAINDFPTPIAITTSWTTVLPGFLCVSASFPVPAQALATPNGNAVIPSSLIKGSIDAGSGPSAYTAFTGPGCNFGVGTNGGSLRVIQLILGGTGSGSGTLALQLDLRGQPPLTPGKYGGTLVIRAVMQ
jgi:hypothetical protein